jgi:hypothetical protein
MRALSTTAAVFAAITIAAVALSPVGCGDDHDCEDGTFRCTGDVLEDCHDGHFEEHEDCAAKGQVCDADTSACVATNVGGMSGTGGTGGN